jgi:hypothetical protein
VVIKIITYYFLLLIMGYYHPCVGLEAMDVIFSSARIGSNVEELHVGVTTTDVCEPGSLSHS